MISIFFIFSKDRQSQFRQALTTWHRVKGFERADKLLITDGVCETNPPGFRVIPVPRTGFYNWSKVWNVGVESCKYEKILYLDCDRIVPSNYLEVISEDIDDGWFLYPDSIYRLHADVPDDVLFDLQDDKLPIEKYGFKEHRLPCPPILSDEVTLGKNPMSGNTAFTKNTFFSTGGLDPTFEGWGYPDTDFFYKCASYGYNFKKVPCKEIHLFHEYEIPKKLLQFMNLFNGLKFAAKWGLKIGDVLTERCIDFKIKKEEINPLNMKEAIQLFNSRNYGLML